MRLVYVALYDLPVRRRISADWTHALGVQINAMRKLLAFMLRPCVGCILSYLDGGDEFVRAAWALRRRVADPEVAPMIAPMIASFLDDRFAVRHILRSACLDWFWRLYVGRPNDWIGCSRSWRNVCQELSDYFRCHHRAWESRAIDLRASTFTVLVNAESVARWDAERRAC